MVKFKFRNINEIQKYYQDQINKGNQSAFKDIKDKNGKPLEIISDKILLDEAERLRKCVQQHIDDYYSSYEPEYYIRTARPYGLRDAFTAQTSVQYDGNKKYIGLYFDDSKSWGKSLVTGELNGYKPYLINFGFKDTSYINPHFHGYRGYRFIEKGILDWKRDLKYHIDIEFSDSSLEFLNRIL